MPADIDDLELIVHPDFNPAEGLIDMGRVTVALPGGLGKNGGYAFKVQLTPTQAIVGFPKFSTIGIGFLKEDDWNTNLPYSCDAEEIADHISHNRTAGGDAELPRALVVAAIRLIRRATGEHPSYGPKCIGCAGRWQEVSPPDTRHWIEECPNGGRVNTLYGDRRRDEDGWPIKDDD